MGAGSEELGRVQKSPACVPLRTPLNRSRFSQTLLPLGLLSTAPTGQATGRRHRMEMGLPAVPGVRDQEERFQGADGCQCAQAGVAAIGKRTVHCSWSWILFHPLG